MRRIALPLMCLTLVACGNEDPFGHNDDESIFRPSPKAEPCSGLRLSLLDDVAVPPANIAATVRVLDCRDEPIGVRLNPDAFEIWEDGALLSTFEAQRLVEPIARDTSQVSLIVLDLSGSIARAGYEESMIDGARQLATKLLADGHRVGLFGFDGRPDLVPYVFFTDQAEKIEGGLARILEAAIVDDSTNLYGAVVNAMQVIDEQVAVDAAENNTVAHGNLVLFTDGRDLAGRVSRSQALDAIARSDHSSFSIGVGADVDRETLADIGRSGSFFAQDQNEIASAFDRVAERVRALSERDYLVSYCTPTRAGAHEAEIRVTHGALVGKAKIEFWAEGFGAGCNPSDIAIRRDAK